MSLALWLCGLHDCTPVDVAAYVLTRGFLSSGNTRMPDGRQDADCYIEMAKPQGAALTRRIRRAPIP